MIRNLAQTIYGGITKPTCICLVSCFMFFMYSVSGAGQSKESHVSYPMLFGNYQLNGFMNGRCLAKGEIDWFLPFKNHRGSGPRVLLSDGDNWYLHFSSLLLRFNLKPEIVWTQKYRSYMDAMIIDGYIYHSNGSTVYMLNQNKEQVDGSFFVPNADQILFVMPVSGNHFVQTFMRFEQGMPGDPVDDDIWSFSLIDDNGNPLFTEETTDNYSPAVVTEDHSTIIAVSGDGQVLKIDPTTGKEKSSFEIENRGSWPSVSLSLKNELMLIGNTGSGEKSLIKYSLDGTILWEFFLPAADLRSFVQPPASAPDGRTYFIHADSLFRFTENGEMERAYSLPPDNNFQFVTVLSDNSVLVTSKNMLTHIDSSGDYLFTLNLEDDEQITAPPVVDKDGGVLLATVNGVYRVK
ncbi:hypothetical protein QA601_17055 [Chitinispirillales bacterium ANBcel5]|uniref:hypothetical protein n=1 Tax=Cellulosispirillum alkaliphilum TaxID=3039283 RepID=UPI002A57D5B7|nr:hypothetical protein [Chitinispirillales bacterium ANBcel5]